MNLRTRLTAFGLVCALLLCCACGRSDTPADTTTEAADPVLTVGAILPDSGTVGGMTCRLLTGLQEAVDTTEGTRTRLLTQTNVTDAALPKGGALPEPTTQPVTEAAEPESFTDADGQVVVKAQPVVYDTPRTASHAASRLLADGCTTLVFLHPMYDKFSAWLAQQYPDITVLQYEGTHEDLPNLQSFRLDVRTPFYMAGALAAATGEKRLGFIAGKDDAQNRAWVGAFALGAASVNKKAQVVARFLGVDADLILEQTVSETLLTKDKCTLLAQSVYTALPVSTAAKHDAPCIGFGYDMAENGGAQYLCSVTLCPDVYFRAALDAIADGTFDPQPYIGTTDNGAVAISDPQNMTGEMAEALQRSEQNAKKIKNWDKDPANLTVR